MKKNYQLLKDLQGSSAISRIQLKKIEEKAIVARQISLDLILQYTFYSTRPYIGNLIPLNF